MHVRWNDKRPGFQACWLWQFGEGPFEVLHTSPVPTTPHFLGTSEITFQPGTWYYVAIPKAAYQYRVEYRIKAVMFHEMWLLVES